MAAGQRIELLSPARDLEAGLAAIRCGADAVYIGPSRFSARQAAGNPLENIETLISFAHRYYARVYAAINTILYDDELPDALRLIHDLYDRAIDGIIIQDTGLLELDLPPVPLIASTQMHNSTPEKVKFLEDVGFSRVILARELTLDQIRRIRRHTSVALECFIHGALCVSASGQCYMSYALGGRSGNRGQCAQPCRKLYSLTDKQGKILCPDRYLLSLKDLNLSESLSDLLDAGVTSFKIEGRLKDAPYVANVTAYYRKKLDEILPQKQFRKSSSGSIQFHFTPDPAKSFNRGFTDYGLNGRQTEMGSIDSPKSTGEYIGKVRTVAPSYFEMETKTDLHNADGICFFDHRQNLQGTRINQVQAGKICPQDIKGIVTGLDIYRNFDHQFDSLLSAIPAERKIHLRMRLYETPAGVALEGIDEDENSAIVEIPHKKEPAQKAEKARQTILRQLAKLGSTDFICDEIRLELPSIYFFPVSVLNQLKRDLAEAMIRQRDSRRSVRTGSIQKNSVPYPQNTLDYTGNLLNEKARQFYQRHGVTSITPAAESGLDMSGKILMKTRYCIRRQLGCCPGPNRSAPAEPLLLTDRENHTFELRFRCPDCGMDIILHPSSRKSTQAPPAAPAQSSPSNETPSPLFSPDF